MFQIKKITQTMSVCCMLFSGISFAESATASNFSYDYAEARIGISPVTYGAGLVFSVHPNAHLRAEIDSEFESDFDLTIAAGFHAPVNDWVDIYGELGMRSMKQRNLFNGDTEFGVELLVGTRFWVAPQWEVGAEIAHISIDDEDEVFGSVSGRFHATELFSIGGQFRINDTYDNQFLITTRFKF